MSMRKRYARPPATAITKPPPVSSYFDSPPKGVIDTEIKIDPQMRHHMERVLKDFSETTGKTVEDGIKTMSRAACKRLATTVHPYGISGGGKMDKFVKNLALQVGTAWVGTNLGAYPATSSMADAHRNARSPSTGRVNGRKFRKEKGQKWLNLISRQDMNAHVKAIQAKAFRAKAAWVKCADDLGKPKMAGVSALIKRHVANARGEARVTGEGLNIKIKMDNNVPWIKAIQYTEDIEEAIKDGQANGMKYMLTTIKKTIEKANRDLKS